MKSVRGSIGRAQTKARRSEMYVRSGRLASHSAPEREVRYLSRLQVMTQPQTLRLVRIQSHIHASPMVESQRFVQRRLAFRAYRQGCGEVRGVSKLHVLKVLLGE